MSQVSYYDFRRNYAGPIDADNLWVSLSALNEAITQAKSLAAFVTNPFYAGQIVSVQSDPPEIYVLTGDELVPTLITSGSPSMSAPDIMLYGGEGGALVDLLTTQDGRELLTMTRDQHLDMFVGNIGVFGARFVNQIGDGVELLAANGEPLIALNGEKLITGA